MRYGTGRFDPIDQLTRYSKWLRYGYRSSIGRAFDIGNITQQAITEFLGNGKPYPGPSGEWDAGNGSIMRLAPIPIFFLHERPQELMIFAGLSSKTTHGAPVCMEACQYMALWMQKVIRGALKTDLLNDRKIISFIETSNAKPMHPELRAVIEGRYLDKSSPIISSGYVVHTLEVALWALATTESFEEGMIKVVNLGGDADTAGAVYGQLAGSIYGLDNIPARWLEKIYLKEEIERVAQKLII